MLGRFGVWVRANPLKLFSVVLILAVVSGVAAYAYLQLLKPQAGPRATITSPPIEFSMEMDKTEFTQGENVTIRLSLKNIGNETIGLRWADFYPYMDEVMYFDFIIADENNTQVYQWTREHGSLQAVLIRTLNHSEQLISIYPWYQRYGYLDGGEAQVPKGTYYVKGLTRKVGLTVGDQTSVITLETPTITIIVK